MAEVSPLTFAIGDIHGCLDKLISLMRACAARAALATPDLIRGSGQHGKFISARPARYVFLGDYVDRGPKSREVVEYVRKLPEQTPARIVPVTYRVKPGDTLFSIAQAFDTSVAKIKPWNRLSSNRIAPGARAKRRVHSP